MHLVGVRIVFLLMDETIRSEDYDLAPGPPLHVLYEMDGVGLLEMFYNL